MNQPFHSNPSGKKRWQHRTVSPKQTIARLDQVKEAVGITRVADLTDLDRIGIPVYQAVRPMGRLLSVSQGKGATHDAAKASAMMEATEMWHAEMYDAGDTYVCQCELDGVDLLDPKDYVLTGASGPLDDTKMWWITAEDMRTGGDVFVPRDVANLDFTRPSAPVWLMRNTNGLAGGNTFAEAKASALAEVIERACRAGFRQLSAPEQALRRLDADAVAQDNPQIAALIELILSAQLDLDLFDLTNEYDVTTVSAYLYDCDPVRPAHFPAQGHGTHLDPVTAITRAITEAVQARMTYISGNRDDLEPKYYQQSTLMNLTRALERQMDLRSGERGMDLTDQSGDSPEEDIDIMLRRVATQSQHPIMSINMTDPAIGIPVAKVLAPGLAHSAWM